MLDIVVLAAGKGTRMKSSLPKVLHPIAGLPLLSHVLNTAVSLGEQDSDDHQLHVVIGHGADLIRQKMGSEGILYSEQTEQLGTGHAVQQVAGLLRDEAITLILYGDVPLIREATLEKLIATVSEESMGLLTIELDDPSGYGRIVKDAQGSVRAIVEQKDANAEQLALCEVNTGVMAVKGKHLKQWLPKLSNDNAQNEYYLTDIIAIARQEGIEVITEHPVDEMEVLGVNNRQQQAELERYLQEHIATQLMAEGVSLLDPFRFDCRGNFEAGEDVVIDVNCVFEGDVCLGNNVHIGPNVCITNSVIGDNVVIKAYSHLEDVLVRENCEIGPFARLRPGTELAKGAKIGNFVETKKSLIGEGSKVNHLSYIGDTIIGKKANVGAGTITCNYDGVNKFATTIGDGAFIGSNASLVAPVSIGDNATVAAGSTITKNVDSQELAVARGKQRNISTWQRPVKK